MPFKARRACLHPSCNKTYDGPGAYCDEHKAQHDAGKRYNEQSRDMERLRFERSTTWRKIRAAYLARHPLCEDCLKDHKVEVAQEVHHINGNYKSKQDNMDDNLMALSTSCHSKRTRKGE
jgi:5-methylcytosine-specific restriction protein A